VWVLKYFIKFPLLWAGYFITPVTEVLLCHETLLTLTLNLPATTIVAPPSNANKWQMGFNSAFKGLNRLILLKLFYNVPARSLLRNFLCSFYFRILQDTPYSGRTLVYAAIHIHIETTVKISGTIPLIHLYYSCCGHGKLHFSSV
jgi:hypothetical protein